MKYPFETTYSKESWPGGPDLGLSWKGLISYNPVSLECLNLMNALSALASSDFNWLCQAAHKDFSLLFNPAF